MPNVTELAAMFSNKPPIQGEKPTFPSRQGARPWQPPGGAKPPMSAKPTFGAKSASSDNILDKRPFNRGATPQNNVSKTPEKTISKNLSSNNAQDSSPEHETKANGDVLRNKTNYTRNNLPSNNRGFQQIEKPSWKRDQHSKSPTNFTPQAKASNENHQTDNSEPPNNFTPPPSGRDSFLTRRISSTSSVGESVKSNQSDRPASNAENDFPSGGSFTSADARDVTWKRKQSDETGSATGISNERPSFLHRSPTPSSDTAPGSMDRRRRPLPPTVFNESPPHKPRRPIHARLPNQPKASGKAAGKRGDSFLSRQQHSTQSANTTVDSGTRTGAPALPGRHPSASESSNYPPHLPSRNSSSQELPALPGRHPVISTTTSIPDRPVPPIPGSQTGSAAPLPERPPLPPPGGPSDPHFAQRSLPSLPNGGSLSSAYDRAPLPPPDDRLDPSSRSPLPSSSLSPLQRKPSVIKTWDDEEDEDDRVYDDTPDDGADEPPPLPPMDAYRGAANLPAIPQEDENQDGELYEPIEQESNRMPNLPASTPQSKEDDKKKKDLEKKEKDMRKKFKLPLEGDVEVQAAGNIKSDSKWFEKFSVRAGEPVDIIRMNDNPKGKWLVRTKKGVYGYVDSVNIEMDLNTIRQTMKAVETTKRDSIAPPPLPPINSPYRPALDPMSGSADGELVYDETVEEEEQLYEEL